MKIGEKVLLRLRQWFAVYFLDEVRLAVHLEIDEEAGIGPTIIMTAPPRIGETFWLADFDNPEEQPDIYEVYQVGYIVDSDPKKPYLRRLHQAYCKLRRLNLPVR